jgi:hypothetical protein
MSYVPKEKRYMSLNLIMVGTTGFEPATSSVSRKRSNQLSYAPAKLLDLVYQHLGPGERRAVASRCNAVPSFTKVEPFSACLQFIGDSIGASAASGCRARLSMRYCWWLKSRRPGLWLERLVAR